MEGGDAEPVGHLHGGLEQQRFSLARVVAGADEEPLAGDRREGNRGLQLRIIAAAGAQISVGPAMIEDIFALAVRLQIARHTADQRSRRILEEKMLRQPAGLARGGAAVLQRAQKSMRDEWVIEPRRRGLVGLRAARAGIPVGRRHIGDARDGAQQDGLARARRQEPVRYRPWRLRRNPFEDHGVGIAQGAFALFFRAHGPGQKRKPEQEARDEWRERGKRRDIVGNEVGPRDGGSE